LRKLKLEGLILAFLFILSYNSLEGDGEMVKRKYPRHQFKRKITRYGTRGVNVVSRSGESKR